jgi:hypothetical protein
LEHAAFVPQAAQDIAVTDSVKTAVAKRHLGAIRGGDPTTIQNSIFRRPLVCDLQPAERKVHEHSVTARFLRDIETRPTGTGANIQETDTWLKAQKLGHLACLVTGGQTVSTVVTATDAALY